MRLFSRKAKPGPETPADRRSDGAFAALREALAPLGRLQSVQGAGSGPLTLVLDASGLDREAAERLRLEAEMLARPHSEGREVRSVLTAEADTARAAPPPSAQPLPAPPAPGTVRVRPGAALPSAPDAGSAPQASAQGPAPVPNIDRILAVSSAKGGVGKSTVAVNLACALAEAGMAVGLLDADVYGPSIPLMLGLEGEEPEGRDSQLVPLEAHGVQALSIGFLAPPDSPMIWRGPVVMSAITQMLTESRWGREGRPLDVLVVDMPPGTGDAQLALAQRVPVTAALLVTTPSEAALADVRRGAAMFRRTHVPLLGVVETMSWLEEAGGARRYVFGRGGGQRVADALALPLLAEIPLLESVREGGDTGRPAVLDGGEAGALFTALARQVARGLDQLEARPAPRIVWDED